MGSALKTLLVTAPLALALTSCAQAQEPEGEPTGGTGATGSTGISGTAATGTPSPSIAPELEDGEHFGYVRSVDPSSGTLAFDLAYFLTGEEASEAAAEHGAEVPPPNDYFIVNDNPRLRTLALAPDLELVLLDWTTCCDELFDGDLAAFAAAFDEGGSVEAGGFVYQGPLSPYRITVESGVVVRIEEQYLP